MEKREIKFRAKRIDNGRWVYGHYFRTPLTEENSGLPHDKGWFFLSDGNMRDCIEQDNVAYVIDPETLGEYTGLKAKNKEIYEGDIIRDTIQAITGAPARNGQIAVIEWYKDSYGGWFPWAAIPAYAGRPSFSEPEKTCEIIGNIYENPEFLTSASHQKTTPSHLAALQE